MVVAAALVAPLGASGQGPPADPARQLAEGLRTLSRQPFGSDVWYASAEAILALGPEAGRKLLPIIEVKLRGLTREYRHAFFLRARRVRAEELAAAAKSLGKTSGQLNRLIRQARRDVLDLARVGDLTKDQIRAKGDPALKRLECGLPDRSAVLNGSKELKDRREALLRLLTLRRRTGPGDGPDAEQTLVALEELSCLLTLPINSSMRRVLEFNARQDGKIRPEEAEGIRDLNRLRLLLGLPAVLCDLKLCRAARDHSTDMRTRKFFSHDSPVEGKETPWKRAQLAGTTASAENIAAGTRTGRGANAMWFHSPGHFKNMLGAHKRVGVGHNEGTWTQVFGR